MADKNKKLLTIVISILIILVIASIYILNQLGLPENWVELEVNLFLELFRFITKRISTVFSDLFKAAVNVAATPIVTLLSLFGMVFPKELAAGITFSIVAGLLVFMGSSARRSSFTKIAIRNVPKRKLRNGLTVLAIILGVALTVGVNIAFDSSFVEFNKTVSEAAGNIDINVRSALDDPFNQSLLKTVKTVEGVSEASGRISGDVVVFGSDDDWEAVSIIGVNSSSDFSYLDPNIKITRKLPFIKYPIELGINGTDAVVEEGLNYSIGDYFAVFVITDADSTQEFNDTGQIEFSGLHFFRVVGVYHPEQIGAGQVSRHTMYIDLTRAQYIFERENKLDYIIVKVDNIGETTQVVENLRSRIGSTHVITPVKEKILTEMGQATSGFQSGLQLMSVLTLCVAVIIILNTIYMNVGERTKEIGILRSVGSSRRQVFWMFFSESLILGIIGVVIGLFLGIPLAQSFSALSSYLSATLMPPASSFIVKPWHFGLGIITGLISTAIGGVFPSIIAVRIGVVNALRPAVRKAGNPRTALKLVAIGLPLVMLSVIIFLSFPSTEINVLSLVVPILMAGLISLTAGLLRALNPFIERVLIPFGRIKRIISRNIERNLTRSTISFTLIGMTLSFIIVISGAQAGTVFGMEEVIHSFYSADVTVSSQTFISRSFANNLKAIDEGSLIVNVAPALTIPRRILLINDESTSELSSTSMVIAIDPTTYSEVMSMKFSEETPTNVFETLDESGTILLTAPLAESLNVTVNSVLELQIIFENDTDPTIMNFKVVGIAVGSILGWEHGLYSSPLSEACYISYESLNSSFSTYEEQANLFFVKSNSDQKVEYIKDRISEVYGNVYQLSMITVEDALGPATAGIETTFTILNAVVMFSVVNAAIGVAAIMVMNISERRLEIGITRALGMSRTQVVASIIGEAIVLAAIGFIVGIISGLSLHRFATSIMRLMGFPIPYIIPFNAIWLSLVLAIVASFISAAYPAYRASKLKIVDALRRLY